MIFEIFYYISYFTLNNFINQPTRVSYHTMNLIIINRSFYWRTETESVKWS